MRPVPTVEHMVTSSLHADTFTITASELVLKAASQLQQIFLLRTLWISFKGPVVLSQDIGVPACLRDCAHIGSRIWDLPLVEGFTELYPWGDTIYKEKISGRSWQLPRGVSDTQSLCNTTASEGWVGTEKIKIRFVLLWFKYLNVTQKSQNFAILKIWFYTLTLIYFDLS